MATAADLRSDVRSALVTATRVEHSTAFDFRRFPIPRQSPNIDVFHIEVRLTGETAIRGSNDSLQFAEAILTMARRVDPSEPQDSIFDAWETLLIPASFWAALNSVRASVEPEVEVSSDRERVGEVVTVQFTARVVLEV